MPPLILTILIPLGLVAYAWIIYPVMVWILGSRRHPERQDPIPDAELPPVTVLVPAHNEETDIGPRIRNLLAQDYPSDRLTVLIGVDGSTDGTASNARTAAGDTNRVQVIEFHNRQGKTATLKALARQATSRAHLGVYPFPLEPARPRAGLDPGCSGMERGEVAPSPNGGKSIRLMQPPPDNCKPSSA